MLALMFRVKDRTLPDYIQGLFSIRGNSFPCREDYVFEKKERVQTAIKSKSP